MLGRGSVAKKKEVEDNKTVKSNPNNKFVYLSDVFHKFQLSFYLERKKLPKSKYATYFQ